MDFNNIEQRLKKTFASLELRYIENVDENSSIEKTVEDHDGFRRTSYNAVFGKDSDEEILNKIFIILHNLASLKDHFKNALKLRGVHPILIEDTINNSLPLKLLVDLVNQEKHGYPLTRHRRSELDPKIVEAKQSLIANVQKDESSGNDDMPDFSKNTITMNIFTGKMESNGGNIKIAITANIINAKSEFVMTLDELVENSYNEFKNIFDTYLS